MNQSIRILHLEDDAADAELVEAILESAGMVCRITRVQTGDAFGEALRQSEYDIILADFRIPAYDGMSALRLSQELARDVPFIFVSGTMGEDAAIEGLTEGATDYVLKDKLTRLEPALKRALRDAENRRERKRAEEALKKAHEDLKRTSRFSEALLSAIPTPAFYKDKEGRYLGCNSAFSEFTGVTSDQLRGKTVEELWPSEHAKVYHLKDLELMKKAARQTYEFKVRDKDGVDHPVIYAKNVFRDKNDQVAGIVGAFLDITERKRAEQALRESEQMLKLVLDTIPVRVFWKNLDSNYLGCNRPFALDAGLQSPEEIIGRNDFEMGWAEQAELYRSDDRLVMETGSPKIGYEEPQTTPDGRRIWLHTNKVPLLDSEGRIKGVLGTYEDITESKRMEEALRTSEMKYRIVANNTYDWEYWVSPEGRFLYTSPSCQRVTGYTASEFETDPKLLFHIVHPDDLAHVEAHLEPDQDGSEPCGLEFRIIHRDGTTRWMGHVSQPVFNAQGSFLGRRGSNRDITDRKQAEKALQDSSQKLKLFAYSVAHDLKSPTIGVYGLSKRLSKKYKDVLDERGRSYCDQILRTSEHIAALVDKINVYIATKEARLSIEEVDIGEVLQMLKEEFSARLSIRQIEWLKPETTIEIRADRLCMLRAFRNFVDNSLKYGGERLSKIWSGYEESEDFHIFSFSDNGKGLKEEDSEKVFGAFQRNETSRGVEGTGLGLTIVKEIAEQHGGKVWVEPRSQKGTTFYLSISKNL